VVIFLIFFSRLSEAERLLILLQDFQPAERNFHLPIAFITTPAGAGSEIDQ